MNIKNKQLIKDVFTQVVESTVVDEKIIADFFHPKYQQNVDGVQLDYSGFIQHMKAQKGIISNITVNFRNIVAEDELVFTNHDVIVTKNDGTIIKIHVLGEFRIAEGKIISCDELTRLEQGAPEDHNIGSMTE
ncbi:nuclear transport factor 2 family protein [Flavobacterium piscisymbiosum]|uniref:Nuclear transport factor 2 family protein n=1 Tax=Flavobacterium piscisymbiosum TaxID=2893753 RepID=A0ABS8MGF2_9FLAO|nr:nuclear transport factor 2 family protein [Flavobacterium sp. F-30]MCC9064577.1 nuclear transport factor 2 family protein [Flavobacterium sp. F-30]